MAGAVIGRVAIPTWPGGQVDSNLDTDVRPGPPVGE